VFARGEPFPEVEAGGFSRRDGTVQFYDRVRALASEQSVLVDLGAGRGEWLADPVAYRRNLRNLRGSVGEVVGADVDPVVRSNPACDRSVIMPDPVTIPMAPGSVDLILSDHTFEHVVEPFGLAASMHEVLKVGGWVCARTPNRWGYVAASARLIPNSRHAQVLGRAQPSRRPEDVFPTVYRMNTRRDLRRLFPTTQWSHFVYGHNPEPAYFGSSHRAISIVDAVANRLPMGLSSTWHIFLRKDA